MPLSMKAAVGNPVKDGYEAPSIVVLGTVTELTLLDMGGPNPDLSLNTGSLP